MALHRPESPPTEGADAAVLILMRDGARELETLLIERTVRAGDPASGQIALPGGRVEPADPDLRATAVRELGEEVGLGPADLAGPPRYVGTDHAPRFQMNVGVFAAQLGPQANRPTARSRTEVAHVFWLPRSSLTETEWVVRETSKGAREVPATVYRGRVLWGFTRRILRHFFERRALSDPDDDDRAFQARLAAGEGS
ncbi:MAG: CoA pyrophosphatase [Thermoplasmata archaeon]|nr:CoA pyrophosphatase [Thermoplasmata archaeon]